MIQGVVHNNSVLHMPSVGLGLWKVDPLSAGELVYEAIASATDTLIVHVIMEMKPR